MLWADTISTARLTVPLAAAFFAWGAIAAIVAYRAWSRARGLAGVAARVLWCGIALAWLALAAYTLRAGEPELPAEFKRALDAAWSPMLITLAAYAAAMLIALSLRFWTRPLAGWLLLNAFLLWFGLSLGDRQFAAVAAAPDTMPIVGLVVLLGGCTWWGLSQGVENDRRLARDAAPVEKDFAATVFVWPDLVYIELIAMVLVGAGLIAWSLLVAAPLEQPANPALTPNPSKAPWYFLGLQELLAYSDAWWVGVVAPGLILFGLAAIPYLDRNPAGNGYYTVRQRPLAIGLFLFGFLMLWILPILIGVFVRGPNWAAFGPYAVRDPRQLGDLSAITFSAWFWPRVAGSGAPAAVVGRELPGLAVLAAYLVGLPWLLRFALPTRLRQQMGSVRFWIFVFLLTLMLTLPLKMLLRWTCGISYIVSMPEFAFNF